MTSHNKTIFPMILAMAFSFLLLFCGVQSARAYEVTQYKGHLTIKEDNSATFEQELVYKYEDTYNGQYVSLGTAGNMPDGFGILESQLQYRVYKNGQLVSTSYPDELEESGEVTFENIGDGYRLKIYNRVKDGDIVKIQVSWSIQNMLFPYQDIAELNWVPISDWDVPLENIAIRVTAPAYQDSQMAAHTGYLREAVNISKSGQDYELTLDRLGSEKRLELHGYWDSGILSQLSQNQFLPSQHLSQYEQTEANIKRYAQLVERLVYFGSPIVVVVAVVIDGLHWLVFKRKTDLRTKMLKNVRLYEAPANLAPMLVARTIYNVDFDDINPAEQSDSVFDFDHVAQATLLDLIDRGNLVVEDARSGPHLKWLSEAGLSHSEMVFVDMAFGDQKVLPMDQLFANFSAEQNVMKERNKKHQKAIRVSGQKLINRYNKAFRKLRQSIEAEHKAMHLPDYYRELKASEKGEMLTIGLPTAIAGIFVLGLYLYLLFKFSTHSWILLLLTGVSALAFLFFLQAKTALKRDGILTEAGLEQYHLWYSFENMLRDIGRFDKTELEAVVLWNRVLVYATLFGYAKEVSRVLKLNDIQLENPYLNAYVYRGYMPYLTSRTGAFNSDIHAAHEASHFNVPSNSGGSSGGGFSSGGFSGGGGGGGGGSF
ncbi:DUF2207 family protein [Streptococcus merionis]|uniref:DUF2207 family protein n=1 Tax=Streptococcus merionis TaxID=400065 RepID=UPI0035139E20